MLLTPPAAAQQLNLEKPAASGAGQDKAASALAEVLDKEARAIAPPGGDPSPALQARSELRKLAAALIREGLGDDADAARRLLIGRTMALRREAFDEAIGPAPASPAREFTLAALVHDLGQWGEADSADDLERFLRDSLWPLVGENELPPSAGWIVPATAGPPLRPLRELAALTDMDAGGLLVVTALESRIDEAASIASYRPASEDLRRSAADVLRALAHANSRLLAPAVRELVRREFSAAAAAVSDPAGDPASRLQAGEALRRLGALCDALVAVAGMDTTAAPVRVLRNAVEELATSGAWRTDAGVPARLGALCRLLDRATVDPAWSDERTLARQFRAAMRIIEPLASQSALQTIEVAPRLLASADATADPAVLGAIAAHARRVNDVRLLRSAADAVAAPGKGGEPEIPAPRRFLAERFVILGQDLGRPERRDLAISELRDLSAQARAWKSIGGEAELNASADDAGWRDATDSKARDLAAGLESARNVWIGSWTTPKALPAAGATRRLAQFRECLPVLADAACARSVGLGDSRLNSWPGWELSTSGAAWATDPVRDVARTLTTALIAGQDDAIAAARKKLAGELSLGMTIGRLERRARALGIPTLGHAPSDALAQVVLGPAPSDSWLAEARADLARMCRAIEEAAAAAVDPARAQDLSRFKSVADRLARTVALHLDAEEAGRP